MNEFTNKYNEQLLVAKNRLEGDIIKLREEKSLLEVSIAELLKKKVCGMKNIK